LQLIQALAALLMLATAFRAVPDGPEHGLFDDMLVHILHLVLHQIQAAEWMQNN